MSKKVEIVEGLKSMLEDCGEMVPTKLFYANRYRQDIKELVDEGKVVVVSNPYGIGDDFVGIKGAEYPLNFENLMNYRGLVRTIGIKDAKQVVNYLELI
jgi:hypothetical protein